MIRDLGEDGSLPVSDESRNVAAVADGTIRLVPQAEQLTNPGMRVTLSILSEDSDVTSRLLSQSVGILHGQNAGDSQCFNRVFWEVSSLEDVWELYQVATEATTEFGGRSQIVMWEKERGMMAALADSVRHLNHKAQQWKSGAPSWGKDGVAVSLVGRLIGTLYNGTIYSQNCGVLIPEESVALPAIWEFVRSGVFEKQLRIIDQGLAISVKTVIAVPFDLAHWQKVAAEKYPNGLPEPQSDDPTQWLFHGHPAGRVPLTADPNPHLATVLQVAVARLVGYRWPAELDAKMRLAPEARAWVEKCKDLERFADDDGVVPIMAHNKEQPADSRVVELLAAAFGDDWSPAQLNKLLAAAGGEGMSLDEWLRNEFFAQHCSVFHQRPLVWHIWDGIKKDGFGLLVHYHRLAAPDGSGRKLLEKIIYTYVGDWIIRQQGEAKAGVAGAEKRLVAATELQKKLELILKGEPPYDLFIRWKPLHQQPIGWSPDINDGVRMNIRPWIEAGVLRGKVGVKWTPDRGKEPESIRPRKEFPWFFEDGGKGAFTGERVNDVHLTSAAKQFARQGWGGDR